MEFWKVPQMWTGDCWIIGGGNSIAQQFDIPSDIIEKVNKGELPYSTYGKYLTPLHSKNVIGTNVAFMLGEWVSVLYFCDARFFREHHKAILAFRNLKVTCVSHLDRHLQPATTNIKRLRRDYKAGISLKPDLIHWNHNSGAAAINFAILAGAKRIMLLGFDMNSQTGKTHWHSVYKNNTPRNTFTRALKKFPEIAIGAKKAKVEILNVSPDSAIECFPKVSLKDVL
jgi:hypothetical protein